MYDDPACKNEDPELFFPEKPIGGYTPERRALLEGLQLATATAVCGRCPHQAECLEDNLLVPYGVFGGLGPDERAEIRQRRGLLAENMSPLPNDRYVLAQRARREREQAKATAA